MGERIVKLVSALALASALAAVTLPSSGAMAQQQPPPEEQDEPDNQAPQDMPDDQDQDQDQQQDNRAEQPGGPGQDVDVTVFHEQLAPYGNWFEHPRYGYVFTPTIEEDPDNWRPYTRGSWVQSEEHGWYWQSEEPFGWATYHYGRWAREEEYGWIWVPGTEWGPAWVAWRDGEDQVGWAPLPPDATWTPDGGVAFTAAALDGPSWSPAWCFVAPALLIAPAVWRHLVPVHRNAFYLSRTRYVPTSYRFVNRRIVNTGIDVRRIQHFVGRPIPRVRVVSTSRPGVGFVRDHRRGVGVIQAYRPRVRPTAGTAPPPRFIRRPDEIRGARRPGLPQTTNLPTLRPVAPRPGPGVTRPGFTPPVTGGRVPDGSGRRGDPQFQPRDRREPQFQPRDRRDFQPGQPRVQQPQFQPPRPQDPRFQPRDRRDPQFQPQQPREQPRFQPRERPPQPQFQPRDRQQGPPQFQPQQPRIQQPPIQPRQQRDFQPQQPRGQPPQFQPRQQPQVQQPQGRQPPPQQQQPPPSGRRPPQQQPQPGQPGGPPLVR